MKLEEQLFQVHFIEDSIPRIVNARLTKKGIISLDNHAIGFAEWLPQNAFKESVWRMWDSKDEEFTIEQLLEIYKKQL